LEADVANPRLTPPQIELLTDIATKPAMYLRSYSRWQKTGLCLVRYGFAEMRSLEGNQSEITITDNGRREAIRRGLVPAEA
jgi:hypothetical protein